MEWAQAGAQLAAVSMFLTCVSQTAAVTAPRMSSLFSERIEIMQVCTGHKNWIQYLALPLVDLAFPIVLLLSP